LSSNSIEFIKKANSVHARFYNYERTKYRRSNEKVVVTCPVHGDFEATPNDHLRGHGCQNCSREKTIDANKTLTTEKVVSRCASVWGDEYDYSKVVYVNADTPITVVCEKPGHGPWRVDFYNHTGLKRGCPKCGHKRRGKQNLWLDSLGLPNDIDHREVTIKFADGSWAFADGYDPVSKTVYEFWGDFWHGNPRVYAPDYDVYGESIALKYAKTNAKRRRYLNNGYKLIEIWESEWDSLS